MFMCYTCCIQHFNNPFLQLCEFNKQASRNVQLRLSCKVSPRNLNCTILWIMVPIVLNIKDSLFSCGYEISCICSSTGFSYSLFSFNKSFILFNLLLSILSAVRLYVYFWWQFSKWSREKVLLTILPQ